MISVGGWRPPSPITTGAGRALPLEVTAIPSDW
jgi:hypothetical protein